MNQQHDLEALKQALTEAKAVHREAVKASREAKRVANLAGDRAIEAFRAYMAARRPARRYPRPRRATDRIIRSLLPGNPSYLGDRRTAILAALDECERRLVRAMDEVSWLQVDAMRTALQFALDAERAA